MKMEFELEQGLASTTGSPRLDWHGLRARLAATHAVRMVTDGGQAVLRIERGSFDRGSARRLAVYGNARSGGLGAINPTALANGKPNQDIVTALAGARQAGD